MWYWKKQDAKKTIGGVIYQGDVVAVGDSDPNTAERPYVFVVGNFGNLWVNYWDGGWRWDNHGAPILNGAPANSGVGIGAVTVKDFPNGVQKPYLFMDNGEEIWVHWWDDYAGQWNWTNQGGPPGVNSSTDPAIRSDVGVVTVMDSPKTPQRPYVFVVGVDQHLWVNWERDSGVAWHWTDLGTPTGTVSVTWGVGVVTVMDSPEAAQRPYAFVVGTDLNLWVRWWDGKAWDWANLGTPPGVLIRDTTGVITVMDESNSQQRPYVFIMGSDENLWVKYWHAGWSWANLGAPPGNVGIRNPGVVLAGSSRATVTVADHLFAPQRPYSFLVTGDRNLWVVYWDGSQWLWHNQGRPPSLKADVLLFPLGAITIKDNLWAPERPYVFIQDTNGELWVNWWV